MNYYDLISLILTQLHERINSDEFLERFRRPNSFVRYRKLTLKQVVAYLVHSKKRSMDIELSDLQRQLPDIDFPDVSRQAVSKARKGILPDLFKELLDKQVEMVYTHLDCPKNWFGYRVFAVDGSTLEIPLSNDTSAEFAEVAVHEKSSEPNLQNLLSFLKRIKTLHPLETRSSYNSFE